MKNIITLVDYGMGNIRSLRHALDYFDVDVIAASTPKEIEAAQAIILPGVGAYGEAIRILKQREIFDTVKHAVVEQNIPFLGICLGMQLIFSHSEESPDASGFDLLPGKVLHFPHSVAAPHVGWNTINGDENQLLMNIKEDTHFYFDHSYYVECPEEYVVAQTTYGDYSFCSALRSQNIFGAQFHPEKSQINGLRILKNFLHYCFEERDA